MLAAGAAVVAAATGARAATSDTVQYGPPPAWLAPAPTPTTAAASPNAPLRLIYTDTQTHVGAKLMEVYTGYRLKVLTPQALAAGNITLTWNPSTDEVTVHRVRIIRGDKIIDVLADSKFRVVERESKLDYAMLEGNLTALLQTAGLQVGDELEFAATIRRRSAVLGDHASGEMQLPHSGLPGAYRVRLLWDKSSKLQFRTTPDLGPAVVHDEPGGAHSLTFELRDPSASVLTEGAPERFNVRRHLDFSEFASWAELSHIMAGLFDRAAILDAKSPIHAEADKIRAASADPEARALAALRLVQDRIRYVYIGLNNGAYRPATADETWTRRFGDCKAKTVLLMALLRDLGIQAEPVLVNSKGGDAAGSLPPIPGAFDHVLVRATIAGKSHWLDGTRLNDHSLDAVDSPPFRWALPVRTGVVDLEPVARGPNTRPLHAVVLDMDVRAGFDAPAKVKGEHTYRGDQALAYKLELSGLSPENATNVLKTYWRNQYSGLKPDQVTWRYDDRQALLVLNMTGEMKPDWDGDDAGGHSLDIFGAGFTPEEKLERPAEQDQTAPWAVDYPRYKRWTTIIRLPEARPDWRWTYRAAPVHRKLAGESLWRESRLRDGIMFTTMSRRSYTAEISPEEAKAANDPKPKFDNLISQVYERKIIAAAPQPVPASGRTASAMAYEGLRLMSEKKDAEAAKAFDDALALDPKDTTAIFGKVRLLQSRGDDTGVLAFLDGALRADLPAHVQAVRAQALMHAGRNTAAYAALDALISKHPDDLQLRQAAVEVAAADKDPAPRLRLAEDALKRFPDDTSLLSHRVSALTAQHRYAEALSSADHAVEMEPEDQFLLRNRAQMLLKLGRLEDALADLDEAWRIDPLDDGTIDARAKALFGLGRLDEARASYDDWISRDKRGGALNDRCWNEGLANVLLTEAEADCAAAIKLSPKVYAFWDSYGLIALRIGRWDEAIKRYDEALALNPKSSHSLYGRALAHLRRNEKAAADADFAAANALDSSAGDELNEAGLKP